MDAIRIGFRESAISLYTKGEILTSWQSFVLVFLTTLGVATIISRSLTYMSYILFRHDEIDDDEERTDTYETDSEDDTISSTMTDENIRNIQNILASQQEI